MDVTQIPLKINQTIQSDGTKLNVEIRPKLTSFFDILSGQFLKSNSEVTPKQDLDLQPSQSPTVENWQELEEMIVEVLAIFKDIKSLIGTSTDPLTTPDEPQQLVNASLNHLHSNMTVELVKSNVNPINLQLNVEKQELNGELAGKIPSLKDELSLPNETVPVAGEVQTFKRPSDLSVRNEGVSPFESSGFQQSNEDLVLKIEATNTVNTIATKEQQVLGATSGEIVDPLLSNNNQTSVIPSFINIQHEKVDNIEQRVIHSGLQVPEDWIQGINGKSEATKDQTNLKSTLSENDVPFTSIKNQTSERPTLLNGRLSQPNAIEGNLGFQPINEKASDRIVNEVEKPVVKGQENVVVKSTDAPISDKFDFSKVQQNKGNQNFESQEEPSGFYRNLVANVVTPNEQEQAFTSLNPNQRVSGPGSSEEPITQSQNILKGEPGKVSQNQWDNRAVNLGFQHTNVERLPINREMFNNVMGSNEQEHATAKLDGRQIVESVKPSNVSPTESFSFAERVSVNPNVKIDFQPQANVEPGDNVTAPNDREPVITSLDSRQKVNELSFSEEGTTTGSTIGEHDKGFPSQKDIRAVNTGFQPSNVEPLQSNSEPGIRIANNELNQAPTSLNTRHQVNDSDPIGVPIPDRVVDTNFQKTKVETISFNSDSGTAMTPNEQNQVIKTLDSTHQVKPPKASEAQILENVSSAEPEKQIQSQPNNREMQLGFQQVDGEPIEFDRKFGSDMTRPTIQEQVVRSNDIYQRETVAKVNEAPTTERQNLFITEVDKISQPERSAVHQPMANQVEVDGNPVANILETEVQKHASQSVGPTRSLESPELYQTHTFEQSAVINSDEGKTVISQESQSLNEETLQEFDSMIEPVMKAIRELQSLSASSTEHLNSANSEQSKTFIMNSVLTLQEDMVDLLNNLGHWLQNVKGQSQPANMDFKQIMEGLAQFIAIQPVKENQKSFSVPEQVKNNIQQLLEEFDYQVDSQKVDRQAFSFDKNQVYVPTNQKFSSGVPEEKQKQNQNSELNGISSITNEAIHLVQQEPVQSEVVSQPRPPSIPVPEFAGRMSEWVGRNLNMHTGISGNAQTRFLLNPEHLGPVEIKISFDDQGQLSAQIMADNMPAKEILETQLQQLKQSLQQQGLVVLKLDVIQQGQMQDSNQAEMMFHEDGSNSSQDHQNPQQHENLSKNQNEANQKELESDPAAFTYGAASRKSSTQIDFTA